MGDTWLQQPRVRGPASDVAAFARAVASRTKPEYWTMKPEHRTQRLSFVKLRTLLPHGKARRLTDEMEEPADLVVERRKTLPDGSVEVTYKFQLSEYEPEALVIAASRVFSTLCFVLACVAPSVDEQSSKLIHNGRSWNWRLSNRRKKELWANVPEETEDNGDDVSWALAEADWAMIDEVAGHWRLKIDGLLARVLRRRKRLTSRRR